MAHEEARLFGHGYRDDYLEWLKTTPYGLEAFLGAGITVNSFSARPFPYPEQYHVTNWTAHEAIRMLERYVEEGAAQPFFLYVSFTKPHPGWDPPADFYARYAQDHDIPDTYIGQAAGYRPDGWVDGVPRRRGPVPEARWYARTPKEVRRSRAGYYGLIDHLDTQIARVAYHIWRYLNLDNIIYAFVSDHGEMLGDHHRYAKSVGYQGSINIPLILGLPKQMGIREGVRYDDVACLEDVMPTLLDACGIPIPAGVDGASLMPLMRGDVPRLRRDWVHVEHTGYTQCLTDGREKFLWTLDANTFEYYDLVADPGECTNLFRERYGRAMELHDRLAQRLAEQGRGARWLRDGRLSFDAVRESGAWTDWAP